MKIIRLVAATVNENLLTRCEECRNKIETDDLYIMVFSLNKNNGKHIILCGNCARELKMKLDAIIK